MHILGLEKGLGAQFWWYKGPWGTFYEKLLCCNMGKSAHAQ